MITRSHSNPGGASSNRRVLTDRKYDDTSHRPKGSCIRLLRGNREEDRDNGPNRVDEDNGVNADNIDDDRDGRDNHNGDGSGDGKEFTSSFEQDADSDEITQTSTAGIRVLPRTTGEQGQGCSARLSHLA